MSDITGVKLIPIVYRNGYKCYLCETCKSVKYEYNGRHYCNRCITQIEKRELNNGKIQR